MSACECVQELKHKLHEKNSETANLAEEREQTLREQQSLMSHHEQLGLQIQDLEAQQTERQRNRTQLTSDQTRVQTEIQQVEESVRRDEPEFLRLKDAEESLSAQVLVLEDRRKELKMKDVRTHQFQSRGDRDTWIRGQLDSLSKLIDSKNKQASSPFLYWLKIMDKSLCASERAWSARSPPRFSPSKVNSTNLPGYTSFLVKKSQIK